MFCKYKNIFGEVGEGVHSIRLFGVAIVDVIGTIIIGIIINMTCPNFKLEKILLILFLLGIFFHRLFCVNTTVDKLLFN